MAVTSNARGYVRKQPRVVTALLTILGYVLVVGTFLGVIDVYPDIGLETVTMLSHAIAGINAITTVLLVLGWRWIRRGEVERHRYAMLGAFALIVVFLVLYLTKVGGGGTKNFVGPVVVYYPYLAMLAIHVVLSVVAVPLVLYALLLGSTHTPAELEETDHARIGRLAAGAWILSLVLGLVTYVLLEHRYSWEYVAVFVGMVG